MIQVSAETGRTNDAFVVDIAPDAVSRNTSAGRQVATRVSRTTGTIRRRSLTLNMTRQLQSVGGSDAVRDQIAGRLIVSRCHVAVKRVGSPACLLARRSSYSARSRWGNHVAIFTGYRLSAAKRLYRLPLGGRPAPPRRALVPMSGLVQDCCMGIKIRRVAGKA